MFRGSIVALVTPFDQDKVDLPRLRELVEFHIDAGSHAIVAAGTTGEGGTLSHQEKILVIRTVVEQARERIPVIAGTAMNATKDCIVLTAEAMECGAHAALIMTPAYIKPTQEGLFQHYSQIAAAVAMPIILYNVPSRTACDLLPETVSRLAKISNIIGIKDATAEMTRLQQILRACDGAIDVYSGDDLSAAQWLLAGAKGVISVSANVAARQMAKFCDSALDEDHADCLRLNEQLMPLHQAMFFESNPIPAKWALYKMGLIANELRLPLTTLSTEYHEAIEQVLHTLKLL
ncbi:MAG: 4-hydroxy-tetrahydrodipicolinate synthase [Tatlockia sp.]|nr:4-hydroxy-tetrahydrodipicolinate synthase [Tatlockia sp.]